MKLELCGPQLNAIDRGPNCATWRHVAILQADSMPERGHNSSHNITNHLQASHYAMKSQNATALFYTYKIQSNITAKIYTIEYLTVTNGYLSVTNGFIIHIKLIIYPLVTVTYSIHETT